LKFNENNTGYERDGSNTEGWYLLAGSAENDVRK
jgi:hypothetical protein